LLVKINDNRVVFNPNSWLLYLLRQTVRGAKQTNALLIAQLKALFSSIFPA
jgi:hypothetical protein